jgi:hypothetical protein
MIQPSHDSDRPQARTSANGMGHVNGKSPSSDPLPEMTVAS